MPVPWTDGGDEEAAAAAGRPAARPIHQGNNRGAGAAGARRCGQGAAARRTGGARVPEAAVRLPGEQIRRSKDQQIRCPAGPPPLTTFSPLQRCAAGRSGGARGAVGQLQVGAWERAPPRACARQSPPRPAPPRLHRLHQAKTMITIPPVPTYIIVPTIPSTTPPAQVGPACVQVGLLPVPPHRQVRGQRGGGGSWWWFVVVAEIRMKTGNP